jgi:hypothetical protein
MVMRLINWVLTGRWRLIEPPAYNLVTSIQHAICVTSWGVIRRFTWMIATRTEPRCTLKAQIPKARIPLLIREWGNPFQRPPGPRLFRHELIWQARRDLRRQVLALLRTQGGR